MRSCRRSIQERDRIGKISLRASYRVIQTERTQRIGQYLMSKGRHKEKIVHPCQFPVGLVERLVLAFTDPGDLVLDPFCGVGSAGVAAALHKRRFWGSDLSAAYIRVARRA
ncbi:MAG: site-specific DNA-methyltransferase [Phycisphaeraceae bacterium]|nr:site-specific DNA-methyltransferase [Phycisphaeraceae bacterium]